MPGPKGNASNALRVCIEQQTAQVSTNVEVALHNQIISSQNHLNAVRRRLSALEREKQHVRDVQVTLRNAINASQQPLKATIRRSEQNHGDCADQALAREAEIAGAFYNQLTTFWVEIANTLADLEAMDTKLHNQAEWLTTAILRDNECVTSAPCRPTKGLVPDDSSTSASRSTSRSDRSAAGGNVPHRPSSGALRHNGATPSPRAASAHRSSQSRSGQVSRLASNNNALPSIGWEAVVNETYQAAQSLITQSLALRLKVGTEIQKGTQRCGNARKAVLDAIDASITRKLEEKQAVLNKARSVEESLHTLKKSWADTAQAATRLDHPLRVVEERQMLRSHIPDHVGNALGFEKRTLREGRSQLKQRCKAVLTDLIAHEKEKTRLNEKAQSIQENMNVERACLASDNPLSTGLIPKPPKVTSKRTFSAAYRPSPLLY